MTDLLLECSVACSQILLQNRFRSFNGSICLMSVDGTDFRIREQFPFWNGWWSHKFNGPGLRYEVGISIQTGDIVWIYGPFPAGAWPDISIFRLALILELGAGEKVEADRGYVGESRIRTPVYGGPESYRDQQSTVRARHETANRRFKQWNILSRVFRHDLEKHQSVFEAVAVITQLSIENGGPLFDVEYHQQQYGVET